MAIEDQIPTLVVMVSTIIAIGWYAVRDNRERMARLEKEQCQLREKMTEMMTEMYDRMTKHEDEDRKYFHEIFNTLSEMKGRDSTKNRKGAV